MRRVRLRRRLEQSQVAFTKYFFRQRGDKFVSGAHHKKIEECLLKLERGELYDEEGNKCTNLLITIAPRFGKTQIVSIDWPARCIANNPRAKFIHLSYSDELALDNSAKCRETISLPSYQKLWRTSFKRDSDSKKKWYTKEGGGMYATAAGGAVTGFGAGSLADVETEEEEEDDWLEWLEEGDEEEELDPDLFYGAIIIDDPIKVDDADNETQRNIVNNRLNTTIASRRNSRNTPIVIIMQRLADEDMAGFVLNMGMGEKFYHLDLPAILDYKTENERSLWPEKLTLEELKKIRDANHSVFMAQYMQDPTPEEGTFFKREWFSGKRFRLGEEPTRLVTYGAGDYAVSPEQGDWTEQAIAGFDAKDDLWFIDWWSYQSLLDKSIDGMMQLYIDHDPVLWMMEKGVIRRAMEPFVLKEQQRRRCFFKVEYFPATKSKAVNAKAFQAMCSQGRVHIPYGDWGDELIAQLLKFTGKDDKRDDKVDVCGLFGRSLNQTFGPSQYRDSIEDKDGDDYGHDDEDTEHDWRV